MVEWDDMTPDERDRFIYLSLNEDALKAITMIMQKKHGPGVETETIMKFAFKVARSRMIPPHIKKQMKENTAAQKASNDSAKETNKPK